MKRILLVEDDLIIARIYRRKLEDAGYRVQLAEDGLAAIRWIPDFQPDLIILDIMLPKLNGIEVLKWVRQNPDAKFTRVVVLSNAFLNELWDQITGLGVQEIMLKSAVSPHQLVSALSKILEQPAARVPRPGMANPATASTPGPAPAAPAPAPAPSKPEPAPRDKKEAGSESEAEFKNRIQREFLDQTATISSSLREAFSAFIECTDVDTELRRLQDLRRKVGFLTHMTGMAGWPRTAQLANALEALLYELQLKPTCLTESVRRTITTATEILVENLGSGGDRIDRNLSAASVLLVEDDAVSSRALVTSLARGDIKATALPDPFKALEHLRANACDIVLLDINLPGMSGISLCEQMRQLPQHQSTPVIFMTAYDEFGPKVQSILSRGDDLISKPVLPIELTVRVIARLFERSLTR